MTIDFELLDDQVDEHGVKLAGPTVIDIIRKHEAVGSIGKKQLI